MKNQEPNGYQEMNQKQDIDLESPYDTDIAGKMMNIFLTFEGTSYKSYIYK